ncbi:superoxide dismutase [Microcystis aeruginosa NIES-1211]|uniref:Superoxide dismutase n=2 Tax=Microcystaceae TaxID=1890449 RepID=A0A5A5R529_MICAE|nr:superoxide dismutase [Microcystis aeruginosa NIES-1211]GCA71413.1 superoxide dismutase [Fe] [Microcystis aeruginosa NIES-2519]GCA84900.1 superoxide dismutase [Fe] [Microcystis aeruginosa NIES-2522]GCA89400.1 superoxide dismutase [Fe] [Microcystis aeruginosa NIES-4264]CCI31332.1 superoxide dismutase, iron/manganese cofactor [Microcystis sp. T1-4]
MIEDVKFYQDYLKQALKRGYQEQQMAYTLPALPYDYTALEPCITKSTLEFHHDKHHAAYVNNYNGLVKDTELDALSLEEVIVKVAGDASKAGVFNNAAQSWNHSFYWNCMKPGGGGAPTGALAAKINADFGSFEKFVEAFKTAGATQFGSGWAWLVLDKGTLKVTKTGNADNPLTAGQVPLLTMDVWEHAYYLDYQNRRPDYISDFLTKLVNWDFVAANLAAA